MQETSVRLCPLPGMQQVTNTAVPHKARLPSCCNLSGACASGLPSPHCLRLRAHCLLQLLLLLLVLLVLAVHLHHAQVMVWLHTHNICPAASHGPQRLWREIRTDTAWCTDRIKRSSRQRHHKFVLIPVRLLLLLRGLGGLGRDAVAH